MKLSLKTIANELNVSRTTVSWVLAGKGNEKKISKTTQDRILKYAKRMNYQPNLLAKSLICGESKTIGLIVPSIGDEFYAQIARAIELKTESCGFTLTFCSSEADSAREAKMIQMLKSKMVDGLIIASTKRSKKEIETLLDESFPFVLIDRFFPELNTSYVIVDNEGGCYQLTKHLLALGRKKIAFVTTDTNLVVMGLRYEGYKKALSDTKNPLISDLYIEVKRSNHEEEIIKAFDLLFQKVPDVDGFCFATHYLALEGLRYFYSHNIDIEEKISLASFHGSPSFSILAPNMSLAIQPIEDIGEESVNVLIESIEKKKNQAKQIVLPLQMCFHS